MPSARFRITPFGDAVEHCASPPAPIPLETRSEEGCPRPLARALRSLRTGCLWAERQGKLLGRSERANAFACAAAATLGEQECRAKWPGVAAALLGTACDRLADVDPPTWSSGYQEVRSKLRWGVPVKAVP